MVFFISLSKAYVYSARIADGPRNSHRCLLYLLIQRDARRLRANVGRISGRRRMSDSKISPSSKMQQKIYQFFSIDPDLAWNTNGTYPACPETKSIQINVQHTTVAKHFRRQSVKTGTPTTRNNTINDPTNIKNKWIFNKYCAIKIFSYLQCGNLHVYGHPRGETTNMIYLKASDHSSAKRTTTPQ